VNDETQATFDRLLDVMEAFIESGIEERRQARAAKSLHDDVTAVAARVLSSVELLIDDQLAAKGHKPCHDKLGHFTACGTGGGAAAAEKPKLKPKGKPAGGGPMTHTVEKAPQGSGYHVVSRAIDKDRTVHATEHFDKLHEATSRATHLQIEATHNAVQAMNPKPYGDGPKTHTVEANPRGGYHVVSRATDKARTVHASEHFDNVHEATHRATMLQIDDIHNAIQARKPKPFVGSHEQPKPGGASQVTHADIAAAKATPKIEHPKSDADVPRFIKETSETPLYKAVNDKIDALAKDTPSGDVRRWSLDKHSGPGGVLNPERQALHDKIIGETLNPKAAVAPGERPRVAILSGPPGSGKTTAGQPQTAKIAKEWTVVNADDIKAKFPEYQGWNAAAVHEESSMLAEHRLVHEAMDRRHNITMDLTGANTGKMQKMVEDFHAKGYDVHLVNIDLPAYKATGRAWDRFTGNAFGHKDPTKEHGRFVPPDYVYNTVGNKPAATYAALKKHPAVRSYVSVSTDVPRDQEPRVIEEGGKR
jgi:hypothetical protein